MEDIDLKNLWQSYDEKLEKVISINQQVLSELTRTKAKSILSRVTPFKYTGIILGVIWVIILDSLFTLGWLSGSIAFTISVGAISLLTKIAIGTYIYHLFLISQINRSESILNVQANLAKLKTSTVSATRIAALQLPFWTTWYYGLEFMKEGPVFYIIVNLLITGLFLFTTIWLYKNINIQNLNKNWMKFLFSGSEWDSLLSAMKILDEVKEYKTGDNA